MAQLNSELGKTVRMVKRVNKSKKTLGWYHVFQCLLSVFPLSLSPSSLLTLCVMFPLIHSIAEENASLQEEICRLQAELDRVRKIPHVEVITEHATLEQLVGD
jgi:hypothetical protein